MAHVVNRKGSAHSLEYIPVPLRSEFNNWPCCSSNRQSRGTVIQICWHSLLHDVSAIKNGNMVCHPKRLARIMGDEERSCPGGFERIRNVSAYLAT
jgi:hypothetical protein